MKKQKIAAFTGEGAYHGSSKKRSTPSPQEEIPVFLLEYLNRKTISFREFEAKFPNRYEVKRLLGIPSQEEIENETATFCWTPLEQALQDAGPLTKRILQEMETLLERNKKFIYIDSKIQYFQAGDLPVDSKLWHIDGSITVRDPRIQQLGYTLLHDMKTRLLESRVPDRYLAYQSSMHCATQFAVAPLTIKLPDCIPSFDPLDRIVRESDVVFQSQPAGSIVGFDGLSLHRAVPALYDGWRLWIRCLETDREVKIDSSILNCYGTVFRQ